MHYTKLAVCLGGAVVLSACGGGGSSGGGGPGFVSTNTAPVLATGSDDFTTSTVAFPYYFADADLDRDVVRGIASIRVINSTTLELVDSEGGNTFRLVLKSGTVDSGLFDLILPGDDGVFGTSDDVDTNSDFEVIDRSDEYFSFYLVNDQVDGNGFPIRERVGGFGYETSSADMPTTSTADFGNPLGAAWMYIVTDDSEPDDPSYTAIEGDFFLTADFANSTFSGKAFEGSETVSLDDVGDDNDELNLIISMQGDIVGNKLDGVITTGVASVNLNGSSTSTPLALTLSNDSVDGQFFGENADVVNGTWGADFNLSDGAESISGQTVGFFEGPEVVPLIP